MNGAASEVILSRALAVGAGGFLGASLRYLVGVFVSGKLPTLFPLATFLINVSGCFGIGFLAVLAEERLALGPEARLFWTAGVLGGYTTFSTFGYETLTLARDGSYALAAINVLGQVALGLFAVWAGAVAARALS
jgi:CrcB protein